MTDNPTTPMEPAPIEPTPTEPTARPSRSRRRLLIGLAVGLAVVAVVVVGVLIAVSVWGPRPPVPYASEAEHYSVSAPGAPTRSEAVVVGVIPTTTTRWADGDRHYSVTSTDLQGGGIPPSQRGAYLHFTLLEALRGAPGVSEEALESPAVADAFLVEPEPITLAGGPAFGFTLEVEGAPAPFHVIVTAHDPMLFMVVYSDSADGRDEDFVESFAYLD